MTTSYDVAVLGLGAIGACASEALARRGARVLGLDRFGVPNVQGSSHGAARAIRLCYYEHADYVPLLQRAYDNWHALSARSGVELIREIGGLYIGREDGENVAGSRAAALRYDLAHEMLDRQMIAERFPQFAVADDLVALYEPRGGVLFPERIISASVELAMRHGADVHGNEPVVAWDAGNAGVELRTARGRYRADRVIVCAGAWTSTLLGELDLPLTVTRQVQGWVCPREPEAFEPTRFPIWGFEDPHGPFTYGFPLLPDRPGVKIARHVPGPCADPDTIDRAISDTDVDEIRSVLRLLPGADGPILTIATCMYTNTPDGHFIVDTHPRHDRVLIAAGFSGHGLKFASVIGEALADLAMTGATDLPVEFLRLARF